MAEEAVTKQVTRSSLVMEIVNGSYMFVVKGYSAAKGMGVGKVILSDEFTVGGHSWAVQFYPDGARRRYKSEYVSLFIKLVSEARDVWALFEITTMDQSGKGKHELVTNFERVLPYYRIPATGARLSVPDSDIGSHIGMLLENEEGCDITFNVSGEKFQAHKLILAARSTKFRSDFLGGVGRVGEEVIVQDMEPSVFKALLHFIYRDALPESELITSGSCAAPKVADTLTAKLLAAADRYDLKRLKTICESQLFKDISANSVPQVLALADLYHAEELKAFCCKFAAENLKDFIKSEAQISTQPPSSGGDDKDCSAGIKSEAQIAGGDDEDCSGGKS